MEEEVVKELPCSDHQDASSHLKDKEESSVREGQHCMDHVKANVAETSFAKEPVVPNDLVPNEGENQSAQVCQDFIPPMKCKEGEAPYSVDWHNYMNQVKIEIEEEPSTQGHQHSVDLVKIAVQSEPFANTHQEPIDVAKGLPRDRSRGSPMDIEKIEEGEKSSVQARPCSVPLLKGNKGGELSPVPLQCHMVQVKIKEEEVPLTGDHQQSMDWVKIKVGDEPFTKNNQGFGGLDSAEGEDSSSRSCWGSVHSVKIEEGEHQEYYPPVRWEEGKEQSMVGWTDSVNQVNIEGQLAADKEHQELIKWVTFKDETKAGALGRNTQVARRIRSSVDENAVLGKIKNMGGYGIRRKKRSYIQRRRRNATGEQSYSPKMISLKMRDSYQGIGTFSDGEWNNSKVRKARYSEEATMVLVELVIKHHSILLGEEAKITTTERKREVWAMIAEKVNAISKTKRTWEEARKRWYDVKKSVREKYLKARREAKSTDSGGTIKVELTAPEVRVVEYMDLAKLQGLRVVDTTERVHGEVQEHHVPEEENLAADLYNGGSQALPFLHDLEVPKEVVEEENVHALEDLPAPCTNGGVEFFPSQPEEDVVMLEVHNGHRNLISKTGMMGTLLSEDQDYSGGLCDPHQNPFKKPKIVAVPQQFPPSVPAMTPAAKFALEEAELINCSERQAESLQNIATLLQLNLERGAVVEKQQSSDLSDIVGALKSVTVALNKNADATADLIRQMGAQHLATLEMVAGCSHSIQCLADAIRQSSSTAIARSNTAPEKLDVSSSPELSSNLQTGISSPSKRPTLRPVRSLMPHSQS